jgi:hypothetical protein
MLKDLNKEKGGKSGKKQAQSKLIEKDVPVPETDNVEEDIHLRSVDRTVRELEFIMVRTVREPEFIMVRTVGRLEFIMIELLGLELVMARTVGGGAQIYYGKNCWGTLVFWVRTLGGLEFIMVRTVRGLEFIMVRTVRELEFIMVRTLRGLKFIMAKTVKGLEFIMVEHSLYIELSCNYSPYITYASESDIIICKTLHLFLQHLL